MKRVVINACFGGFGLSDAAFEKLLTRKGIEFEIDNKYTNLDIVHYYKKGMLGVDDAYLSVRNFTEDRADADLIAIVEEMGSDADGRYAELKIVIVPDDVEWEIAEYDGNEHVAEKHRTWS